MGIHMLDHRTAVFLDRDGVINRNIFNPATAAWESPLVPDQVELLPGVPEALRRLQEQKLLLFVISNQPNFAKAKASMETLKAIHQRVCGQLERERIQVAAYYYCYHHPLGVTPSHSGPCRCRKPSPFFIFQARDSFALELDCSWMIGDRSIDVECGKNAGVRTIRIYNSTEQNVLESGVVLDGDFLANGLPAAVEIICDQLDRTHTICI